MFRSSLDTSIKPILCPRKSGPTHLLEPRCFQNIAGSNVLNGAGQKLRLSVPRREGSGGERVDVVARKDTKACLTETLRETTRATRAAGVKPRLLTEPTTQPTLDPVGPQVPPARAAASAC